MTKFEADAIAQRSGRAKSTYTGAELRKNMQKYLETGVHPELEAARREREAAVVPLPDVDINRPFLFMEVSVGKKDLGRLVIEVFDDMVPVAATLLRNRCAPGATGALAGAASHKLVPHFAVFFGKSAAAAEGVKLQLNTRLRHLEAGTVSVSLSGDEVAIALTRAPVLDSTHQVVGRVNLGKEVLDALSEVVVGPDDTPVQRVAIRRCGPTNAQGTHESLDDAREGETAEQGAARLQKESERARSAVVQALQVGMGQKRKPGASPAAKAGAPTRHVKARLLDNLLDDLSSDSSSSSSESEREDDCTKGA